MKGGHNCTYYVFMNYSNRLILQVDIFDRKCNNDVVGCGQ